MPGNSSLRARKLLLFYLLAIVAFYLSTRSGLNRFFPPKPKKVCFEERSVLSLLALNLDGICFSIEKSCEDFIVSCVIMYLVTSTFIVLCRGVCEYKVIIHHSCHLRSFRINKKYGIT